MKDIKNLLKRFFSVAWLLVNTTRKVLLNLIFFGLIAVLLISSNEQAKVQIPDGAALVLNISGDLVEQAQPVDPLAELTNDAYGRSAKVETLLSDVLEAVNSAAGDPAISALVIDSSRLGRAGLSKLQSVGEALDAFKASGKPVVAVGGYYNQNQYYLASHADTIYLNPMGMVSIDGYGRYRMYYREVLEKLKVNTHLFRVGTFKSAAEPYIRDDMSDAAKTANRAWLNSLWQAYTHDVAENRGLVAEQFSMSMATYLDALDANDGDFAQLALQTKLVDQLASDLEVNKALIALTGENEDGNSYKKIGLRDYVAVKAPGRFLKENGANVAIVVAKGTIMNGNQPAGAVGGKSTSKLLRQARLDDDIKAVVLRIDSPGGSAFASEQIRNEVIALKAAGKPVVASMSTLAASGGYWIAASADEIWAAPTTITGSIGIFGLITTFENSLAALGIHTDGVGTTELAGLSTTRALPEDFKRIIQRSIERGYQEFISLVAEERGMTPEQVNEIAQGRVWIGAKAKELGLVDQLGDLNGAIAAAAKLAELDHFKAKVIRKTLTPMQEFYQELFGEVNSLVGSDEPTPVHQGPVRQLVEQLSRELDFFNQFDDPMNSYLYCLECGG